MHADALRGGCPRSDSRYRGCVKQTSDSSKCQIEMTRGLRVCVVRMRDGQPCVDVRNIVPYREKNACQGYQCAHHLSCCSAAQNLGDRPGTTLIDSLGLNSNMSNTSRDWKQDRWQLDHDVWSILNCKHYNTSKPGPITHLGVGLLTPSFLTRDHKCTCTCF